MVLINLVLIWLIISYVFGNKGKKWTLRIVNGRMLLGVFPRDLFQGLYFLIFLSIAFFLFIEKIDICKFADDNTLFSCGDNLSVILKSLEHDMKTLLR